MRKAPEGWPRITSAVFYDDAGKAIDWLCRAFGFETRLRIEGEDGSIAHSELVFGDGVIMVGQTGRRSMCKSPTAVGGGNTQSLMIYVDDVDAQCERARAAGGKVVEEPKTTDYGGEYWSDRTCQIADLEGHHWWLCQRMRTGPG